MVAEHLVYLFLLPISCSLAKISMVAEPEHDVSIPGISCSLAKISMVAEPPLADFIKGASCSLAKISMVAELFFVFCKC